MAVLINSHEWLGIKLNDIPMPTTFHHKHQQKVKTNISHEQDVRLLDLFPQEITCHFSNLTYTRLM